MPGIAHCRVAGFRFIPGPGNSDPRGERGWSVRRTAKSSRGRRAYPWRKQEAVIRDARVVVADHNGWTTVVRGHDFAAQETNAGRGVDEKDVHTVPVHSEAELSALERFCDNL